MRARADAQIESGGDARAVTVLITALVCLWLIRFFGMPYEAWRLTAILDGVGLDGPSVWLNRALVSSPDAQINSLVYWSVACILGYVAIPLLVVTLFLRESVWGFGAGLGASGAYGWVYLLLLAAIAPLVVVASFTQAFQSSYPFYQLEAGEPLWPTFWVWEGLYAIQFASLEFFFRGFLLHGLVRRFGYLSIFVMTGLYMMIHFQKPAAEAFAAVIAGVVLGTLALESRSIWWGAVAHVTVALSMDFLALWHLGLF